MVIQKAQVQQLRYLTLGASAEEFVVRGLRRAHVAKNPTRLGPSDFVSTNFRPSKQLVLNHNRWIEHLCDLESQDLAGKVLDFVNGEA